MDFDAVSIFNVPAQVPWLHWQWHHKAIQSLQTIIPVQPIKADRSTSSLWGWDFSHDLGRGWRVEKRSGCAWTSFSVCAKSKLEQQTHRHDKTTVFLAFRLRRSGLNAGVRFPSSCTNLEISTQMNPPHRTAAIVSLLTGGEVLGKESQAGRAVTTQHGEIVLALLAGQSPLPFCGRLRQQPPGNGNSKCLSEMALAPTTYCIFYMSADEDRMEKTDFFVRLSPLKHLNLLPSPCCSLPSCFSQRGKC